MFDRNHEEVKRLEAQKKIEVVDIVKTLGIASIDDYNVEFLYGGFSLFADVRFFKNEDLPKDHNEGRVFDAISWVAEKFDRLGEEEYGYSHFCFLYASLQESNVYHSKDETVSKLFKFVSEDEREEDLQGYIASHMEGLSGRFSFKELYGKVMGEYVLERFAPRFSEELKGIL